MHSFISAADAGRWKDKVRIFEPFFTASVIIRNGVLLPGVHFIQKPFLQADFTKKVREVLEL